MEPGRESIESNGQMDKDHFSLKISLINPSFSFLLYQLPGQFSLFMWIPNHFLHKELSGVSSGTQICDTAYEQ